MWKEVTRGVSSVIKDTFIPMLIPGSTGSHLIRMNALQIYEKVFNTLKVLESFVRDMKSMGLFFKTALSVSYKNCICF